MLQHIYPTRINFEEEFLLMERRLEQLEERVSRPPQLPREQRDKKNGKENAA